MLKSVKWTALWLGAVACGETLAAKPCGEGTKEVHGVCVGSDDCNVTETRTAWVIDCADGRTTVIDKTAGSTDGGAGGASGASGEEGGAGGAGGGTSTAAGAGGDGEARGGASASGGTHSGGSPTNNGGSLTSGGGGATGGGAGESQGGSDAGQGGQAGAAGEGPGGAGGSDACEPGTNGCACANNQTCQSPLTCRSGVCVAVPEPPTAVTKAHFELPPGPFDVVLDTEKNRLFASYGAEGMVRVLDLGDGDVTSITTGYNAEHMTFDPARDEVVISLPTRAHSPFWFDEDQEGWLAIIDAVALAEPTREWLALDPWQVVADGRGHVVVSGASGQWTSMLQIDLATAWFSVANAVYNGTNIRIHPNGDRIYGATNGLSPGDLQRFDVDEDGRISWVYDSPYRGEYPMCGDLRIHPNGQTIYTPCGHVFRATNTRSSDMTWVANVGMSWIDLGFDSAGRFAFLLNSATSHALYVYDTEALAPAGALTVTPAERLLMGTDYLVLIRQATHDAGPYTDVEVMGLE